MLVRWDHFSLAVQAVDPAIDFFCQGLGFSIAFQERGMSSQIASMLGTADATCDLVQLSSPDGGPRLELIAFHGHDEVVGEVGPVLPGMAHAAFRVHVFEETVARLISLGARKLGEVTRFSDGRSVYLSTPFGAFLEIEESTIPAEDVRD